jgi:hypothetical protein
MKHKWGDKVQFPLANKTEQTCARGCGITKVKRYESPGGHDRHWEEFYLGGERVHCEGTPPCSGPARAKAYDARNYPL